MATEMELLVAAHEFIDGMVARADRADPFPLWHGWALREAFAAGAKWADSSLPSLGSITATKPGPIPIPAEWTLGRAPEEPDTVLIGSGFCFWGRVVGTPDEPAEPKARLMVAAPAMLEALKLVKLWMLGGEPGPYTDSKVLEIVDAAIVKAEPPSNAKDGKSAARGPGPG